MQIKHHKTPDCTSQATYSECTHYRYSLTRRWSLGTTLNFVMLNPSTADETQNDPTVERCERRARMLGFGGFCVTNIFAWRDTDPHAMRRADHPVGPENNAALLSEARASDQVVAAWGTHGAHRERGAEVAAMLRAQGIKLYHLGLSKHGHPRHPLYVPYAQQPVIWQNA